MSTGYDVAELLEEIENLKKKLKGSTAEATEHRAQNKELRAHCERLAHANETLAAEKVRLEGLIADPKNLTTLRLQAELSEMQKRWEKELATNATWAGVKASAERAANHVESLMALLKDRDSTIAELRTMLKEVTGIAKTLANGARP